MATSPAYTTTNGSTLLGMKRRNFLQANILLANYLKANIISGLVTVTTNAVDATKIDVRVDYSAAIPSDEQKVQAVVTYNNFPPQGISRSETALAFGNVTVGNNSIKDVTVKAFGVPVGATVDVASNSARYTVSKTVDGVFGASVSFDRSADSSIGDTAVVYVKFTPVAPGAVAAQLTIDDSAGAITPVTVELTGTGV